MTWLLLPLLRLVRAVAHTVKGKHTTRNCSQFLGHLTTLQTVVRKNLSGRIVFSVFTADSVKSLARAGLVLERNCTLLFVSAVHLGGIRMLLFVSFSADCAK